MTAILVAVALAAVAGLGWMLFESQWVEFIERDVTIPGLPRELDGLTVLHLSDFHLGTLSLNGRTLRKAVEWAEKAPVDLVAITGDLVSRRRGERALLAALERLAVTTWDIRSPGEPRCGGDSRPVQQSGRPDGAR